jgi:16S rRNA (uracil1498-N3)-methyltransferase
LRRFFCQTLDDESVSLSASESRHLCQVLRARCGDRIILLDGRGKVAQATLYSVSKRTVLCRIDRCETLPAPSPTLSVFVATPRGKAMGRLVRQATELGVAQIVPILCENSVARPDAKTCATWESEGREACKQSGNPYLPQIEAPIALSDALARWPIPGFVATAPRHASGAHPASDIGDACSLWIGPEGGFSDSEQDALLGSGLTPLLIGNWVLRVETALVACAGWIRHANPLS